MNTLSYWAYIGTFYLCLLTWQDYRENRLVDDRRNWFMAGVSVSLISHVYTSFGYKLALTIILTILYVFLRKVKAIGEADINTIAWVFLGFGLINPYNLLFFVVVFAILTVLFMVFKNYLFKIEHPIQYYGVITTCFVFTNFVLGMY